MPHDVSMNVFLGEQIEIFIVQPLFFIAFYKLISHALVSRAFSFMNITGLNALKKNGEPENDKGETGP